MIRALIFDCFGVLITDALQVIHDELRQKDPQAAQTVTGLVRASNRGIIDPHDSNTQIANILGVSLESYQQQIRDGEVKNTKLLEYIRQLHATYKTAILSNISATGLAKRFTQAELDECFDEVVSSGEIQYAKPDSEAYQIVADRLGVQPDECVFIDDREGFCEAAEAVGMRAIVYTDLSSFHAALDTLLSE